jgi:taurine dioxygenase
MMSQAAVASLSNAHEREGAISVTRLCGAAGAVVSGVDLAAPLDDSATAAIRQALLDHCVIVVRDQDLAPAQQIAFTEIFGKVEPHPQYKSNAIDGYPEILVLEHKAGQYINGKNDIWHSDLTFLEAPPLGSVLQCRAAWEGYSDTMFANQCMAYDALSDPLRQMLDGLTAEHSGARNQRTNNAQSYNKPITYVPPPVVQPVVRTHPETGRKALFVNPAFTTRIVELSEEESRCLLDFLFAHSVRPDFVYRHHWRVGDVVMFDNRCLLHYVVPDHPHDMHRLMHRTTASGDRPF